MQGPKARQWNLARKTVMMIQATERAHEALAQILGHADPAMTLRVFAHAVERADEAFAHAVERADEAFAQILGRMLDQPEPR